MNAGEMKAAIAAKAELTQAAADKAVKALIEVATEALKNGDTINLPGFGAFSVSERAARVGRNPQTGAEIKIAASKGVRFRIAKGLKDALNPPPPAPKAKGKSAPAPAKKKK